MRFSWVAIRETRCGIENLLECAATVRKGLFRHEKSKPWRQSDPDAFIPGERESDQRQVCVGRHKGETFLEHIAPVFVAENFWRELLLIKQDKAVVRDHVYLGIPPEMQPPDEQRQPFHFAVDVPDQRLRTAVTQMIHFFVTEYHEKRTEGARASRRILNILDLAAICAELIQQGQAIGPCGSVFSIHSGVQICWPSPRMSPARLPRATSLSFRSA